MGYIGGAIQDCIYCYEISFSEKAVSANGCACSPGYKWSPLTKSCECNRESASVLVKGNVCLDCSYVDGSTGLVTADRASCECINMYVWNAGINWCKCDSRQNFVVFSNGYCTDCAVAAYTNGLAYAGDCACINGLIWDPIKSACLCPEKYVIVGSTCTSCSSAALPEGVT